MEDEHSIYYFQYSIADLLFYSLFQKNSDFHQSDFGYNCTDCFENVNFDGFDINKKKIKIKKDITNLKKVQWEIEKHR